MNKEDNNLPINIINENQDLTKKESNSLLKSKLLIKYDYLIKDCNTNKTLLDLKNDINKKFNMKEYDYELFIGEQSLNFLSNDTQIIFILNKYKNNRIQIKSFKNILDSKKQIDNYEKLLTKKISLKIDDIKLLKLEYEKIQEDLKNIKK